MGRDYSAHLAVGYLTLEGELEAPFTRTMAAKTKTEIRYNEVTGQPYIKEFVEEPAGDRVIFEGEDLTGDPLGLAEAVAEKLTELCGFEVDHHNGGDMYEGQHEFVFGLRHRYEESGAMDPSMFSIHSFLLTSAVAPAQEPWSSRAQILKLRMLELGLKPDNYLIHCLTLVS